MPSASSGSSRILFGHHPFFLYFWARGFSEFSYQIATVAVVWQVYSLTNSAFALGMVGLVQFIPSALLVFAAGHAADRYDRKRVVQLCQIVEGLTAAFLAWGNFAGWLNVAEILAALVIFGTATAFESPAAAALLPGVTPEGMFQKGLALSSAAFQVAVISGPALGGLAYAVAPGVPYAVMAVFWLLAGMLNGAIKLDRPVTAKEPPALAAVFAGVGFVRHNPAILGTISLDLFAVVLARHAINRRVGMRMFQAVIIFGLATVVFALSHLIWLSLLALVIMGAADMVSVVIRVSLVQLGTPDEMRGRVGAVNYLFVNASNQLGQFESGITAALFGAMPAAALGGLGTIAVALLWMKLFPTLREVERLE